jgi:cobalt-zinc-cadmium efflux system protein
MGAGHNHGVSLSASGRHRWRLGVAFGLVVGFLGIELAAGILSNSLALISDAGHMAADAIALGAALIATKIATRRDRTGRRTFGSYRAEVFAAGLSVLIMLGVAAFVIIESIFRFSEAPSVPSLPLMVVGTIGLGINVACLLLLRSGSQESLNVRGAYFEVIADAVGSLGAIAAGVLILVTGSGVWDTVIALGVGLFILVRAVILARQVLAVLGQAVPPGVDIDQLREDLRGIAGVSSIHDLHVWSLTSGMNVATAHLVVGHGAGQTVLTSAQATLHDGYGIEHATFQIEDQPTAQCEEVKW